MDDMPMNKRYQEILNLDKMLTDAGIPHTIERIIDGWQVCYPVGPVEEKACVCDVIEHFGSFGGLDDRLELMGLLTPEEKKHDSVVGYLTAEDVFTRIKAHWDRNG